MLKLYNTKNKTVKIYVNECEVTITRDAYRTIVGENGKRKNIKTKGVPITTRFVIVSYACVLVWQIQRIFPFCF